VANGLEYERVLFVVRDEWAADVFREAIAGRG
jgi:hypothetical protein